MSITEDVPLQKVQQYRAVQKVQQYSRRNSAAVSGRQLS